MKLSIIIVNYNVKFFLEQCLCSVKQAIEFIDAEVLVIDNCSTDNSINYLEKKFGWVKFIANKTNEGFAKANNTALKHCTGDYILFLNPDTILPESILQNCIQFFEQHPEAGAVGVRMLDGSGNFLPESKRAFPSPKVSFLKLCGLSDIFPKSKLFNKYALGFLPEREVHEVDVLCGAFFMTKRNILMQNGGFDEAFFMYGEDIDLSYRIQKAGDKIYYLGTETIIHFKGESARKGSLNYVRIFYQAMGVFVKKHYTGKNVWLMNMLLHLGIYARAGLSLIAAPFSRIRKKLYDNAFDRGIPLFLAGDSESVTEAEAIIKKDRPGVVMKKTTDFDPSLIELKEPVEIVFCTGAVSYAKSIMFIGQLKPGNSFKWHGLHTGSIVGSMHKKFTGVADGLED
ncbi:MAG TPA: glycosyltransferase family 2 protein [Panacibacter sp.]|nr:glycosyltransferase family 2 protein [Panacibacter sp.]